MQHIWWLNSTLCAKVHLVTFDLYNYQTPRWPDCRTSKKCPGDIGLSENNSAENSPWGGGLLPAQSLYSTTANKCIYNITKKYKKIKTGNN